MHDRAAVRPLRPKSRLSASIVAGVLLATVGNAAPAQARGGSSRLDPTERRVIRLINANRRAFGLRRVVVSRALSRSANYHSRDMLRRNFFAHNSSNGMPFDARVRRYKRAARIGENLAYIPGAGKGGQARQIVSLWLNSPEHRSVLLSRSYRRIGVARRTGRLGGARVTVFTADFTSKR